ncbi:hypothetical protein A2U01_0103019, partial [Trifolium medium]|nr:hypothetical protein [Trifolium medium]
EKEKSLGQVMTGNVSDEHTIVNSANIGDSEPSEKIVGTKTHAIDVDDLTSGERY